MTVEGLRVAGRDREEVLHRATLRLVPTAHPRHMITETRRCRRRSMSCALGSTASASTTPSW